MPICILECELTALVVPLALCWAPLLQLEEPAFHEGRDMPGVQQALPPGGLGGLAREADWS